MPLIVSGLTTLTDAELIRFAKNVHTALKGNANVPAPNPTLPALQALISTAETGVNAYEAEKDVLRTRKNTRDEAIKALCDGLRIEADTVQAVTAGNPDKIETTGFRVRTRPTPVGTPAQVTNLVLAAGPTDGTLKAAWKPVRGVRSYELEASPDPITPNSWIYKGTVTKSKATVNSFMSGAKVWVRVRGIGAAGPGHWSDPAVKTVP
jgi:hypothetical protein